MFAAGDQVTFSLSVTMKFNFFATAYNSLTCFFSSNTSTDQLTA